jgi:competence protein ComEC
MSFKVITYDVEQGNSHFLVTPNEKTFLIDAGSHSEFSPAEKIKENGFDLGWFLLSHYDEDHLSDIENVDKLIHPEVLSRNRLTREELLQYYPNGLSEKLNYFLEFEKPYTRKIDPIDSESHDWGEVSFRGFSNGKNFDFEMNDLSEVTFAKYRGWGFLFPGDLEKLGWLELLKSEDFIETLKKVNIFVASHHGREAGYCDEIFEYLDPSLIIISDKSTSETSVTEKYYNKVNDLGLNVTKEDGRVEKRKVLTTRNDGAIYIEIDDEGNYKINIH